MEIKGRMLDLLSRPLAMEPTRLAGFLAVLAEEDEDDERRVQGPKWHLSSHEAEGAPGVAVIEASGPVGRAWLSPSALADMAEELAAGHAAVVVSMDSPGGLVDDVGDAAARLAALGVPLVVHTPGLLCSAAYWLASGADAILASSSAEVGSIGVYCPMIDCSEMLAAWGVKIELAKTGELKGMGYPGTAWTDAQKAHMQELVGDIFEDFKAAVQAGRPDVPEEAMTGGAYMAKRAAGHGLLDEMGGLGQAVALAASLAEARQKTAKQTAKE